MFKKGQLVMHRKTKVHHLVADYLPEYSEVGVYVSDRPSLRIFFFHIRDVKLVGNNYRAK